MKITSHWCLNTLDKIESRGHNPSIVTTITGKNQITLPAEIVKALVLTPGMRLEWEIGPDGTIIARPRPSRARLAQALQGAGRRFLRPGDDPIAELEAERLSEDDDEGVSSS